MKTRLLPLITALLLPASAAEPSLAPGKPAPPLAAGEFIQGEPVREFEKGKVHLLEFWATWCGPCVDAIPHVNALQKKFADRGLIVIGQNVWERNEEKVKPFLQNMGDEMTYRVAMDDKSDGGEGRMAETWMKAAGLTGIPAAFIVDQNGIIAWIGHPARIDETLLGSIIDGSYDIAAEAEKTAKEKQAKAVAEALFDEFRNALHEKDMEKAAEAVGKLEALENPQVTPYIPMMRFDIAMASGDGQAVGEHALAIRTSCAALENKMQAAFMLLQFARQLCDAKDLENLDPQVAVQLARQAVDLTDGADATTLETLARAKFVAGDKEGAIASQQAAIRHAEHDETRAELETGLDAYKEDKLPPPNW